MSKLKIAHFITEIVLGGAQRSTLNTIKFLDSSDYDHFLLTSTPVSPKNSFQSDFESIKNLHIFWMSYLVRPISLFKDFISFIYVIYFLRAYQIDVIHTHSSKAGLIGRWAAFFAGKKSIHTVHGFPFNDYQRRAVKFFYLFLERLTAAITHKIIFIAESDLKKAITCGIGDFEKRCLIRDVIDLKPFFTRLDRETYLESRKDLGIKKTDTVVGCIACFKKQKGLSVCLKAIKVLKEKKSSLKVFIVGDGDERKQIEGLIKKYGLEDTVKLLGWRKDICKIIKIFDIIVLSSWWEGLPLVVLESMAAGLPIIATRVDGIPEVITNNENGFLIEPGDSVQLSEKLLFLMHNQEVCRQMGRKNFSSIKSNKAFDVHQTIRQLKRVYSHV